MCTLKRGLRRIAEPHAQARCDARNRNCINMKVGQFFMSPPGQIRMSLDTVADAGRMGEVRF
jgi:hypothetical protein